MFRGARTILLDCLRMLSTWNLFLSMLLHFYSLLHFVTSTPYYLRNPSSPEDSIDLKCRTATSKFSTKHTPFLFLQLPLDLRMHPCLCHGLVTTPVTSLSGWTTAPWTRHRGSIRSLRVTRCCGTLGKRSRLRTNHPRYQIHQKWSGLMMISELLRGFGIDCMKGSGLAENDSRQLFFVEEVRNPLKVRSRGGRGFSRTFSSQLFCSSPYKLFSDARSPADLLRQACGLFLWKSVVTSFLRRAG